MACLAGTFELISLAGRGAFADVWRGIHATEGYPAAIKIPRGHGYATPRLDEGFLREVRSTARLAHPGIIDIWDHGRLTQPIHPSADDFYDQGTPFFVMEWIEGGTLSSTLSGLDWPTLQRTLLHLLDALSTAHARGIIHRDIKPDNILMAPRGPVLSDFGIAFVEESIKQEATDRSVLGTPSFMAPEQLCSELCMYGPWTDLYAVGCLTFFAVTGERPFRGKNLKAITHAHFVSEVPPINPRFEVPAGLVDWIQRLLRKAPHNRYQFAADAANDLLKLDASSLVSARQTSRTGPLPGEDFWTHHTMSEPTVVSASPFEIEQPTSLASEAWLSELPGVPGSWQAETLESDVQPKREMGRALFAWSNSNVIGRESERTHMWSRLKEARDNPGLRILGLNGSAGLGKSALARWLRERAHELGAADAWVMTHELQNGYSCGLSGMLRRALRVQGLSSEKGHLQLERLCARHDLTAFSDALTAILDEGRHASSTPTRAIGLVERFEALSQVLAALCRMRTMLIVIDDVQWGEVALGWLEVLASRWSELPVLVVCTLRDDLVQPRHPARFAFKRWAEMGLAETIDLEPLPEADLAQIVSRRLQVDEETLAAAVDKTQGNPLFLESMVNHWIQEGTLVRGRDGFRLHGQLELTLPDSINRVWFDRLTSYVEVDGELWQGLELAATLGVQVDAAEWETICSSASLPADSALLSQLDEGELARLDDFEGWSFRHVLFRDFLVAHARKAGRAERWHRLVAEMLESCDNPYSERVGFHWLRGGRPVEALAHLSQARQTASMMHDYAGTRRIIMYEAAALRQSGHRLWSDEWQTMASRWYFISRATGDRERAIHRLGRLIDRCRAANLRSGLAKGLIERSLALAGAGHVEEAIEHQREGLAVARANGDQGTACSTQIYLGYSLLYSNVHEEAEALLKDALQRVQGLDDSRGLRIDALRGLATLWTLQGRLDDAKSAVDEALELVDETTAAYRIGIVLMCSGRIELNLGNVTGAIDLYRRAGVELERIGNADVWTADYLLADAYGRASRWAEAHEAIRRSARFSKIFKAVDGIHHSHAYACRITWKLGLWDELDEHLSHLDTETPRLMPETIEVLVQTAQGLAAESYVRANRMWAVCAALYRKIGFTEKAEWAEAQGG